MDRYLAAAIQLTSTEDLPHNLARCEALVRDEAVVVETALGRLGLSICYDVRFPELYRRLADQGADVILVPAAFTLYTGKDHWHPLLRARAIENQAYVLAPGQFGQHNEKRWT